MTRCGEAITEIYGNDQEVPDVSAEKRALQDFFKRILKLRWIGSKLEAERMLQTALRETNSFFCGPLNNAGL
jgi:hypothetical protein